MKQQIIILVFLWMNIFFTNAQERRLHINIEGAEFSSLVMAFDLPDETIMLTTNDSLQWQIIIPDSVFYNYSLMGLAGFQANGERSIFIFVSDSDKWSSFAFDDRKELFLNIEKIEIEKPVEGHMFFRIKEGSDPEINLSLMFSTKLFTWWQGFNDYWKDREFDKKEVWDNYLNLVKKYPDAYTLAKSIKPWANDFSVDVLQQLYAGFSERVQKSNVGVYIRDFYERKLKFTSFENIQLPEWKTGKEECILQDTTRYNLVLFSASWCRPCHELIPLLKEIYSDLHDNLDMVYISADDKPEQVEAWKKLMEKEQIPWRSLITGEKMKEVITKYFVEAFPTAYLIQPDGSFEIIELQDEKEKARLYELVENK
jgi:thiol-disulfide isomerase/thioredoxin